MNDEALAKLSFAISQTRGYANLELTMAVAEQFLRCADSTPAPLVTAMLVAFSKVQLTESFFERAAQKAGKEVFLRDFKGFQGKLYGFSIDRWLVAPQVVPNLADFEPSSFVRGHLT